MVTLFGLLLFVALVGRSPRFMEYIARFFGLGTRIVADRSFLYLLIACSVTVPAFSAEQTLDLVKGWNAVYMEIQPETPIPEALFGDQPIEMVAVWLPSKARVTSLTALDALATKPSEWHVWQPEEHPAAFLNTLFQVQARRAMLIKASAATQVTITGEYVFERRKWQAPSFNLTGFDVDPAAPPSFARFFDGSRAHEDLKIFKLQANDWVQVSPTEAIERGRAYWVWTKEGSDFQGPLDLSIALGGQGALQLGASGSAELQVKRYGSLPVVLSVEASVSGVLEYAVNGGDWTQTEPQGLEVPEAPAMSVRLRHAAPELPRSVNLAITGGGLLQWLPVQAAVE